MASVLVITVTEQEAELAADALWQAGAMAVEEQTLGSLVELRAALGDNAQRDPRWPGSWHVRVEEIDDSLADGWRDFAGVSDLGDGWAIVPAWRPDLADGVRSPVFIDPGPTFGMGDHPTTRLTSQSMLALGVDQRSVLDVGSGSGVLAVIAAMAGASTACGVDITPAVNDIGPANARRNGVEHLTSFSTTPLAEVGGAWDLVLANILAPTLIELADDLVRLVAKDGRLMISGVLAGRYDHVVAALRPLRTESERTEDGWACLTLSR